MQSKRKKSQSFFLPCKLSLCKKWKSLVRDISDSEIAVGGWLGDLGIQNDFFLGIMLKTTF